MRNKLVSIIDWIPTLNILRFDVIKNLIKRDIEFLFLPINRKDTTLSTTTQRSDHHTRRVCVSSKFKENRITVDTKGI